MTTRKTFAWVLVILVSLLLCIKTGLHQSWAAPQKAGPSAKPETVTLPDDLTYETIDDLLVRLDDGQVRRLVLDLLQAEVDRREAERQRVAKSAVSFEEKVARFGLRLRFMLSGFHALPRDLALVFQRLTEGQGIGRFLYLLLWLSAIVAIGWLVEWFVRRKTADTYHRFSNAEQLSGKAKVGHIVGRTVLDLAYLGVFIIATAVPVLLLYLESGPCQLLAVTFLSTVVMIRVIYISAVLVFSPKTPALRFSALDDASSGFFFGWIIAIGVLWIVSMKISMMFQSLGGSEEGLLLMSSMLSLVVAFMLVTMAWTNRKRMLEALSTGGGEDQRESSFFSSKYAPTLNLFFIIYVFFVWVFSQITKLSTGELTRGKALIFFMVIPFYVILDLLAGRVLKMTPTKKLALEKKDGEGGEIPEEQAEVETGTGNYLIAARKVVRVVLAVFAISLIFWLWGFEMPFEGAVIKAFFNIFVIIMLAYLVWTYIKSAIERKLGPPEEPVGEAASDDPGRGGTRDRSYTLLPLIQKTIGVVLLVTVVLIVLSSLGVEIGPLLASAGIFGLAIGLGSQTLVRDVVAGIFFIIDDAFRVGDYVTIGSEEGSVVKTSLRALTLRHYKGQIQVITYGDIKSVTNWTRGPMLIKFSLPLPAETNPQKVKKIIKKVNQEMMDDEKFGPNFVEELKSQGVKGIEDGVMTIRVKFRAKPGTQFELKREAYRRIHAALTEAGIKFASRGVTVNIPQSETAQGETAAPGQATTTPAPHPTEMAPSAGAAAATILTDTKKKKRK